MELRSKQNLMESFTHCRSEHVAPVLLLEMSWASFRTVLRRNREGTVDVTTVQNEPLIMYWQLKNYPQVQNLES